MEENITFIIFKLRNLQRCDKYENGVYCCDFKCLDNPPKPPIRRRKNTAGISSLHSPYSGYHILGVYVIQKIIHKFIL